MRRFRLAAASVLLLFVHAPDRALAQQWIGSGWVGGGTEHIESDVRFAPQAGLRLELSPARDAWLGAEVAAAFRFENMSCPADGGGCGTGLLPVPLIALFGRYEVGDRVKPYAVASIGRIFTTRGFDTVGEWGIGAGIRASREGAWSSYFVEGRYRNVARYDWASGHCFELVIGLGRGG